ncbi:hemerythrin domain-containing protein [Bacillus sp. BRMEA1]|nr:hemerythrin domain-containing protein [Neobacillus endophyticus]
MSAFGGNQGVELSAGLKQLKNEHPPLLQELDGLYSLTQKIDEEVETETTFGELIIKVKEFKDHLDKHSEREEGVLFPMMGVYIGTSIGPIAAMEYEHDQAKLNISTFLSQVEQHDCLTNAKRKELAQYIQNAYFILTEHFAKEENVLFPMAERMLSQEEKAELLLRIQTI